MQYIYIYTRINAVYIYTYTGVYIYIYTHCIYIYIKWIYIYTLCRSYFRIQNSHNCLGLTLQETFHGGQQISLELAFQRLPKSNGTLPLSHSIHKEVNLFKWTLCFSSYSSLGTTQTKVQKRLLFSQSSLCTMHHYAHWHYFKRVHNTKNNEQIINPFSEMLLPRLLKNPQKSLCQDVCPVAKCEHCVSKIFIKRDVTLWCLYVLHSGNKTALVKFQFHPTILGKIIFASFRLWWNHPWVCDDLGKISCTWLLTAFSFCWSQRNWTGLRLHWGCRLLVLWLGGVLPLLVVKRDGCSDIPKNGSKHGWLWYGPLPVTVSTRITTCFSRRDSY